MNTPASSAPVYLHRDGDTAEIILNAPARRNALNIEMWAALPGLVDQAEAMEGVTALILHGGDTSHFAAGADISEFETVYADADISAQSATTIARALNAVEACSLPVIAAIEGVCIGGGVSLALAADIRIASEHARFGATPAKLGLVYPAEDTARLVTAVGPSQAKDMLFTGAIFEAGRALRIGLVDDLCPPGEALAKAREKARLIASVSQYSVRETKKMIAALTGPDGLDPETGRQAFVDAATGPDFREGYRAFLEKRKPDFPRS